MPRFSLLLPLCMLSLLTACDSAKDQQVEAPPPGVLVAKAEKQQIRETLEFIGRTVAVNDVSLNAQVSGYLLERLFEEGAEVHAEDLLFRIDPAIYEAQVAAAEGSVAKAEAALDKADKDLKRYRILLKKQSVSQQQVDEAESNKLQADAELKAAGATLLGAQTDLSFTEIRAPIHGRIGRALISIGNLVGPQSGELAINSVVPRKGQRGWMAQPGPRWRWNCACPTGRSTNKKEVSISSTMWWTRERVPSRRARASITPTSCWYRGSS